MHNPSLSVLLGVATTTTVALFSLPAQAEPRFYEIVSGTESLTFIPEGLSLLEGIGLKLGMVENTAPPQGDYDYGFELAPPPATTSKFSLDFETGEYNFLGGVEQLLGSIFFEVDPLKLSLDPVLELGDFLISFESVEEVDIIDTVNTGLPILNVFPSSSPVFDFVTQSWILDNVQVTATKEFSDFLMAAGSTVDITGETLVLGRLDRSFQEINSTPVPESDLPIAVWVGIGSVFIIRKWWQFRVSSEKTSASCDRQIGFPNRKRPA